MPIEMGIWKLGATPQRVSYSPLESERRLEETLAQNLLVLASDLLLLGWQVGTSYGKYIDILAMDRDGLMSVNLTGVPSPSQTP